MRFFPSAGLFAISKVLRQCLWLCLPALLIGAALRLSLLVAIPEAYYGLDSNSYYQTAYSLWEKGKVEVPAKRRWIYPVLLAPTPLLPGRTAQIIALVQHGLGLVTIVGMGWVVLHLTARPRLWVPVVTTLAAIWPRMLWYEHEVIAESLLLASIVLATALAFPVGALRDRQRLFWFLVATTLIVAVKPHGRPIWLGLILAATCSAGGPWTWGKKNLIAVAASVLIMLSGGSSSQGAWLLLSSTLPLVPTEGAKWSEYRQLLRPHIEESRQVLATYPWAQGRYKKILRRDAAEAIGPEWVKLYQDRKKFSQVTSDLAREAILGQPLQYARLVLLKIALTLSDNDAGERLVPREFWKQQEEANAGRWEERPGEMRLVYELDRPGYDALVVEREQRTVWYEAWLPRFTRFFVWTRSVNDQGQLGIRPAWFGVMALFGMLTCFLPWRLKATAPLWLPLFIYLGIIFGIGDGVSRYLQPIEWIGMTFIALGWDWALQRLAPNRSPIEPAPEAQRSGELQPS